MKFKDECLETISSVLASKKSKLSKSDREKLIILREKIKNEKSRKGLFSLLQELVELVGISLHFFKDS